MILQLAVHKEVKGGGLRESTYAGWFLFILRCEERSALASCMKGKLHRLKKSLSFWLAVNLIIGSVCTRPPDHFHILRGWDPDQKTFFQTVPRVILRSIDSRSADSAKQFGWPVLLSKPEAAESLIPRRFYDVRRWCPLPPFLIPSHLRSTSSPAQSFTTAILVRARQLLQHLQQP